MVARLADDDRLQGPGGVTGTDGRPSQSARRDALIPVGGRWIGMVGRYSLYYTPPPAPLARLFQGLGVQNYKK